ncbi:hypothetical protein [Absidia glauca]|uniref:Ndc10 domain-containing protein n=1 Tax=Absidia glauca TaxID=4829 RepID=A0A168KQX4_ABSGL|nr:hypothetical protein [Absidia glauca]
MVDIVGANENQTRPQGRWTNTMMNSPYLTNPLREMVRSMSGFPTNGRSFYFSHAALDPPTSLCKTLFPAIDEWHDRLAAKEHRLDNNNYIQPIVAVNAFVQVIMMIGETYTRLGVMMELRPCHPIWQHSFFSDSAYFSFKR